MLGWFLALRSALSWSFPCHCEEIANVVRSVVLFDLKGESEVLRVGKKNGLIIHSPPSEK